MTAVVQNLRTTDAAKLPVGLAAGQIAFNLANKWMLVGVGGDDILVDGKALPGYGAAATVLGVPNVAVPVKPGGKGYEIYDLNGSGVEMGAVRPAASAANIGQVFVDTSTPGKPALLVSNGTSWLPPVAAPRILTLADNTAESAAGADVTTKFVTALTTAATITAQSDLHAGDQLIITDGGAGPQTTVHVGGYVYDGTNFILTGGTTPDAGTTTAGVVKLALPTDVQATGSPGKTAAAANAVATADQLVALRDQVGALTQGSAFLGTYNASTSAIAAVTSQATDDGRAFAVGAKINAGTGPKEGDYFLVSQAGTPAGDDPAVNVALAANDHLFYTGTAWSLISTGYTASPVSVHGATDVNDAAVATVADIKGFLVRDNSVAADGTADAYRLANTIDLGQF